MHEALVTRGDVQGMAPEFQNLIFVRQNCVLVHNEGCHQMAETHVGQRLCCGQIITYEGAQEVTKWLQDMAEISHLPETVYREALSLVQRFTASYS